MDDLLETLRCTLCGHRENRVVKKRETLPLCVQCPSCLFIAWRNDPYCVSLLGGRQKLPDSKETLNHSQPKKRETVAVGSVAVIFNGYFRKEDAHR